MAFAALTFTGETWLLPAGLLVGGALVLLVWSYRAAPQPLVRWLGPLLKLLGLAALAFCLLEPMRSGQRVRPGSNLFAIVADNSQGLQIRDPDSGRPRAERLRELLDPAAAPWQTTLGEHFDVRRYLFDSRLAAVRDFGELTFEGRASAIGTTLRTLRERFQGRPLAGILLLTDGNATDLPGPLPDLAGLPPVYPVVIGETASIRDLSVTHVGVTQSAFEDAPVTVQADVRAAGYTGEPVVARLLDRSGQVVREQSLKIRGDDETAAARFQFKPDQPGLAFYEVRVGMPSDLQQGTNAPVSTEATLVNNARVAVVDRDQGPYRVLYVAGRPNWEYKFLNRAVQEDPEVQLVGLIRVARREPKFEFRGRAGETSNPLFRGFGEQAPEAVERYDQPVLVRLNTRDELELRAGFPRTAEELFAYHAVILDDIESAFFAPDQAALVQRFVSERGGGLLMLGGMETFREGAYHRTPIGDLLPVYLDAGPAPRPGETYRFELSREGWLQPWARVHDTEAGERARLDAMPPFVVANRVRGVKPGAAVVANARTGDGTESPALAIQRFGRGRTGALLIGDLWRWGMQEPAARQDMEKAWRQIVRWLVADVPKRVEIASEPIPEDPNGAVRIQVRARDPDYQPLDNATITVEVEPVAFGNTTNTPAPLTLRAEPSAAEPGVYEATFVPRAAGGFRAAATVVNAAGAGQGRAETGWSSDPVADEFQSLVPNRALMEEVARRTGGEVVEADRLAAFVDALPRRQAPVMESWSYPAWHTPLLFAFALACLVAEWGLRRWKGLP